MFLSSLGLAANRVPLSGAAPGFKGDVVFEVGGEKFVVECKRRKRLPRLWSATDRIVAFREDRGGLVFVVPSSEFERLLRGLKNGETEEADN